MIKLPDEVYNRAKSLGEVGDKWIDSLPNIVKYLEGKWEVSVGEAMLGGTYAFVAVAKDKQGNEYALKINIPEGSAGGEYKNSVNALLTANGNGYARLYKYDEENRAYLLERLGAPLSTMNLSVNEQIEIICKALNNTWRTPINKNLALPKGAECTSWFKGFFEEMRDKAYGSSKVIDKAIEFIKSREDNFKESEMVLIHGDAHSSNILKDIKNTNEYKFIDPDGAYYEKSCDLGVLMREWHFEYEENPSEVALKRCELLHKLTGVDKRGIWEWGYIQMVSTGLVLMLIGQNDLGSKMLGTANRL